MILKMESRPPSAHRGWILLGLLGLAAGACAGEPDRPPERRPAPVPLVEAGRYALGSEPAAGGAVPLFVAAPQVVSVRSGLETHRSLVVPQGRWWWPVEVPRRGRVNAAVAPAPGFRDASLRVEVAVLDDGARRVVAGGSWSPGAGGLRLEGDLRRWASRRVTLEFSARGGRRAEDGAAPAPAVAWSNVTLTHPPRPAPGGTDPEDGPPPGPPNVLMIVVDTLRADRLTVYGAERVTSPRIEELLARRGSLAERAYAPAPWTVPSVAALLTGRSPSSFLRGEHAAFGVPPELPVLPEELARCGFDTAAFFGNPTLTDRAGFDRGFGTVFRVPAQLESMHLHADTINERAVPWLAAHRNRPFFAYVHYIDPHDPYESPDLIAGRSSAHLSYRGELTGRHIQGLFSGHHRLSDPEDDLAHLRALYDEEVRYVDAAVGKLVGSLAPEVLSHTLVVLTSDHGEELYDHGGWKHGRTLYEEQLRVPLIVRWDGQVPAGVRIPGPVRLADLAATVLAAAGCAPHAVPGHDLLPALRGEVPPPRIAVTAQHLNSGPLRASAMRGGYKLVVFDREAPFEPRGPLETHLHADERRRLARVELYDLRRDPGETENLLAAGPHRMEHRLFPSIHRLLGPQLPGLRVVARGLPAGSVLRCRLRMDGEVETWRPYLAGPGDRHRVDGATVELELAGGPGDKGVVLTGPFTGIEHLDVSLDGRPLAPGRVVLGDGGTWEGGLPIPLDAEAPGPPPHHGSGPTLAVWAVAPDGAAPAPAGPPPPEALEALRALGYVD